MKNLLQLKLDLQKFSSIGATYRKAEAEVIENRSINSANDMKVLRSILMSELQAVFGVEQMCVRVQLSPQFDSATAIDQLIDRLGD